MNFRTEIPIQTTSWDIHHGSQIMVVGSCFAERISQWLIDYRFTVEANPNGIIFHPTALVRTLTRALECKEYTPEDLFFNNGFYSSFDHHGSFSRTNEREAIHLMNEQMHAAVDALRNANVLLVTFGSAWAYYHVDAQLVVANCHKFPGNQFRKELTPFANIVAQWSTFIEQLRLVNPKVKCIFTVSPVRYLRDGAHGNQLSKANLLLAAEELSCTFGDVHYFPAYEIVLDELRDYRFYADDMIHPSNTAVEYIISKFAASFLSGETRNRVEQLKPMIKFLAHRPIKVSDEEWNAKIREKQSEIEALLKHAQS